MRRFDERTGAEMWVSDVTTQGKYEWCVIDKFEYYGPHEIASGHYESFDEALKEATEIYEQLIEV